MMKPSILLAASLTLLAPALTADTILLTDGKSLADVEVVEETLQQVTYKPEGKSKTEVVDAEKVLRVDYSRYPQLVDRALSALGEELYLDAVDDLNVYVDGFLESGKRERMAWAPAYAAWRYVEIQSIIGDWNAAAAGAERLITKFEDSRYVPMAWLAKARALKAKGDEAGTRAALDNLAKLVDGSGISPRWKHEADLARVIYDDKLNAKKRLEAAEEIAKDAGAYPSVRDRARVVVAEALLESKEYDEAEKILTRIVGDPKADDATLAGAYTGLGDCLFQRGAKAVQEGGDGSELLTQALMNYMRVVVVFKNETRYVPKAMFYAGRAYQLTGTPDGKERAERLYRETVRQYGGTNWASEAKNYL